MGVMEKGMWVSWEREFDVDVIDVGVMGVMGKGI